MPALQRAVRGTARAGNALGEQRIAAARNRIAVGEAAEEGPLEPVERRPRPLLVGHRDIIAERDEARKYPRRHLRRARRKGRVIGGDLGSAQRPFRPGVDDASDRKARTVPRKGARSEEHTSALQSLMRISYAVFC